MRAGSGVAIDLGTVNTLVYVPGRGVVIEEPTAIAISRDTGQVVSVGSEADGLDGKEPQGVDVVHPLRDGVIADLDAAVVMLQAFLRRAQLRWRMGRVPAVVCLPVEATYVERRAVVAAAEALRPRCAIQLIDEPVAAAAGAGIGLAAGSGSFIVDIGGGTTEVAVISLGGIVFARSVRVGGDKMDEAIINYIRRNHNLLIGESSAERIKMELGAAAAYENGMDGPYREVKGRDLMNGVPREVIVSQSQIAESLAEPVTAIVETVKVALENTPPELAADVVDKGIVLTGGGALLYRLDQVLREATGLPVVVAEEPLQCVALGTGRALEEMKRLRNVLTTMY
jgi:rod shape-determining protein MreB and related proteins